MNKKDLFIITAILMFAFMLYIVTNKEEGAKAEIIYNHSVVKTVDLSVDTVFSIDALPDVVFQVKDKAIAFIASDCSDKICIHSGWLKYKSQSAVCLPNKIMVKITGGENLGVDVIVN